MARLGVVWFVALCACGRDDLVLPTPAHEGLATVVYAALYEGRAPYLYGSAFADGPAVFEVERPERILALGYAATIEELQLGPGEIANVSLGHAAYVRTPPKPERFLSWDAGTERWIDAEEGELERLRIEPFDYPRCLAAGGCAPLSGAPDRCALPCATAPINLIPALPLPACPSGWISEPGELGGVARCRPDEPPFVDCPLGEQQLVGTSGCTRLGPPCPAGLFPDLSGETRPILYVDPAAPAGGDGQLTSPFDDIRIAHETAGANVVFALAKGVHHTSLPLVITSDRVFRGACVEETQLQGSQIGPFFHVGGATLELRDLNIASPIAVIADQDSRAIIEGVHIAGGSGYALHAARPNASLTVRRTVVRDMGDRGVIVDHGEVDLRDVSIIGVTGSGVSCGDAMFGFNGVRIAKTRVNNSIEGGLGLTSYSHCRIRGSRLVLDQNEAYGAYLSLASGGLEDIVVRDTEVSNFDGETAGFRADSSTLTLERVFIQHNLGYGYRSENSKLEARDLVVLDSWHPDMNAVVGVHLIGGTRGNIERVRIEDHEHRALVVATGGALSLFDVAIAGVTAQTTEQNPSSSTFSGAGVLLERVAIEGGVSHGMSVDSKPGTIVRDVTIRGARQGLHINGLGGARFERLLLEDNTDRGVRVERSPCVSLETRACASTEVRELTIRRTRTAQPLPIGLEILEHAELFVLDLVAEDNEGGAVSIQGTDFSITRGLIRGSEVGLAAPFGAPYLTRALTGVRFEANAENLRLEGD